MLRNVVLFASSFAILAVVFVGYLVLVDDPVIDEQQTRDAIDSLPVAGQSGQAAPLRIADAIEVPPGQGLEFKLYDERTGEPTEQFQCSEWTPVRGAKNVIRVTQPQLTIRLPSGMITTISAGEGQITVDRIERVQGRPKLGWLRGDVRIVIDRETARQRTPTGDRPHDLITIAMQRLEFDLELGELHTLGPVRVTNTDFQLSGTGLDLVWNQADNVVESLELHQGEQLVLYGGAGLFRAAPEDSPQTEAPDQPEQRPLPPRRRKRSARGAKAYTCVLSGKVVAEQFDGRQRLGGLAADEVRLLFDVRGAADRFMQRSPASAPASRSSAEQRERLVVRWSGPLRLGPELAPAAGELPRRHFEARGGVSLTHGDGVVRCDWLEYHDETQQVWLHAAPDGRVDFSIGTGTAAVADSVYIDRRKNLVKLVGDVSLVTQRGGGRNAQKRSLRCSLWAELHLAAAEPATDTSTPDESRRELLSFGQLDSATFVGDAEVDLGGQKLSAQRIDVAFKASANGQAGDPVPETVIATGDVRLERDSEYLECQRLELTLALMDDGELYPRRMDARAAALIVRGGSWIRGERIWADLEPAPPEAGPDGPALVLRNLEITGDVRLSDPRNEVKALGDSISAVFTGLNRLSQATVRGTPEHHAGVRRLPYTVRGEQIDLDWEERTLHVDGRARLRFKARRSLQGRLRERPVPVDVTCDDSLHIDGIRNTVHFAGNVVANSGQEQLKGDMLTLLLEDVEKPTQTRIEPPGVGALLREARRFVTREPAGRREGDFLELRPDEADRMRKEPVRLFAENALVQSETYQPGVEQPLVHSSISAPLLEVDILRREIVTHGRTVLLLTSRRLDQEQPPQRAAFGIPSALITRGPSQTAMQCEGSMTYVLGADGPGRRDSVLFEDGVLFVHRTGQEMVNLEQMLPQVRTNPRLVSNLESRNTSLQCDRLECGFLVDGGPGGAEPARQTGMRLNWLLAAGNAYLRDVQGPVIREVYANQLDFDRPLGLIRVLGTSQANTRIYEENTASQDSKILVGEEFIIDLRANTVRSGPTRGEIRDQ